MIKYHFILGNNKVNIEKWKMLEFLKNSMY